MTTKKFTASLATTSKILKPGTHYCRIADIKIEVPAYNKDAMTITLVLEGPELKDFEGAMRNKMNPSDGTYKGQIAYVKNGKYPFAQYTTKNGKVMELDTQVIMWINNLAKQLGVYNDMAKAGISGDTVEEYIYEASKFLIDENLYAYFTIGGKEKSSEYGMNYNMYFPKSEKNSAGVYMLPYFKDEMGLKDEYLKDHMIIFDADKHIEKEEVVAVISPSSASFGSIVSGGATVTYTGLSSGSTLVEAVKTPKSPLDF